MEKQYTDLLDDFYYTAYQLSTSTLYSPIDDKEGKKAIKHCSILLVVGIIVNFISLWIAPIDFDRYNILPELQISVLVFIGLAMGCIVKENWDQQRGYISEHQKIYRLESHFKKLQKQLRELLSSEDTEAKPWNNTIEYFRNLYGNGYSSISYEKKEYLSKEQLIDRITIAPSFIYYKKKGLEETSSSQFVEWTIFSISESWNVEYEDYFDQEAYERALKHEEARAEEEVDFEESMYNLAFRDGAYTNEERYLRGDTDFTDHVYQSAYRSNRIDSKIREVRKEDYQKTRANYTLKSRSRSNYGYFVTDASTKEIVLAVFSHSSQKTLILWFPWYLSAFKPSDSIPNGFTQDSWILSMMRNAERKRDLVQREKKEQEYLRKERRRDLFHQGLRITKLILTGIITIGVFSVFTYFRMGFFVTLINTILIPTMIYVLILDRFLW